VSELLDADPDPGDEAIRDVLGGNLCRCTGYEAILTSVRLAARKLQALSGRAGQ
jgi:carbon-monoxide dehydrogenase small subunit